MATSLLDFLGRGAVAGVGAKNAALEGKQIAAKNDRVSLLDRLKQEQDAAERMRQSQMDDLQRRNIEDQIRERNEPKAALPIKPSRQIVDGQIVDLDAGTAAPIQGFQQGAGAPKPRRTQVVGGQIVDLDTGKASPIEGFTAPPARTTLPTQGERKAAAFYASGKQGYDTLESLIGGDDPSTPQRETGKGKEVPGWFATQAQRMGLGAGNVMTNEQVRQMRQSALMLSDAWLRYTSGAAVPEQEVERFAESFIPRPGDDPGTLKQKSDARRVIIEALRTGAGRALDTAAVGQQPDMDDLDGQIDAFLRQP